MFYALKTTKNGPLTPKTDQNRDYDLKTDQMGYTPLKPKNLGCPRGSVLLRDQAVSRPKRDANRCAAGYCPRGVSRPF